MLDSKEAELVGGGDSKERELTLGDSLKALIDISVDKMRVLKLPSLSFEEMRFESSSRPSCRTMSATRDDARGGSNR